MKIDAELLKQGLKHPSLAAWAAERQAVLLMLSGSEMRSIPRYKKQLPFDELAWCPLNLLAIHCNVEDAGPHFDGAITSNLVPGRQTKEHVIDTELSIAPRVK